jgi:uncharacterized protein (DUF1697 family)
MKKLMVFILVASIALSSVACGNEVERKRDNQNVTMDETTTDVEEAESFLFKATVLSVDETSALVEPLESEDEIRSSGDQVYIDLPAGLEVAVGDEVTIEYDGMIMESYPLQINTMSVNGVKANE